MSAGNETHLERNWLQVTPQRDCTGANFERGVIDMNISVGGQYTFVPSKSYFRIRLKLKNLSGASPPVESKVEAGDEIAFADDVCANLFNNCYFRAGGSDCSSMVNYVSQGHVLKQRLSRPKAWQNSIGRDAFGIEASKTNRFADAGAYNEKDFIFQPPIGMFDVEGGLGAGQYRISMNPNSNYKRACVEGGVLASTGTAGYGFDVTDLQFFACIEKNDKPSTGVERLYLSEMQIQSKKYSKQLDFTVPPSTKALTIFVQRADAGSSTDLPLTKFKSEDSGNSEDEGITHLQLTYANTNKPSTNWASSYVALSNQMTQRYLDTQIACGLLSSEGGTETFAEWEERGGIYHFNFERDADDRCSHLQLQMDFAVGTFTKTRNVFVAAHYTRTCEITRTNGMVSSVTSLSV